jgi:hypothetical protein
MTILWQDSVSLINSVRFSRLQGFITLTTSTSISRVEKRGIPIEE